MNWISPYQTPGRGFVCPLPYPDMPKKAPPLFRYEEINPQLFTSHAEYQFAVCWIQQYPAIDLHTQHRFHPKRRYALDFAHLPSLTGIEIQGGTWNPGMGHSTGKGIRNDIEKIQLAAAAGWSVIQIASDHVCDPEKLAAIAAAINHRLQ